MWPIHLPFAWPQFSVAPMAASTSSGSVVLWYRTVCVSTVSVSPGSHRLSLFQFPKDYQQQCISSTVAQSSSTPLLHFVFSSLPKQSCEAQNVTWGHFEQDFTSWMKVCSLKFSSAALCIRLKSWSACLYTFKWQQRLISNAFYCGVSVACLKKNKMQPSTDAACNLDVAGKTTGVS